MIIDRFEFREGPVHAHNYNFVRLQFNLRNPTGLTTPEISQRIRGILEPFGLLLNIVEIDISKFKDTTVKTTSIVQGDLVEEIKIPLSMIIEDKLSSTVSFSFNKSYYAPESINNEEEEELQEERPPLDRLLVLLLAFLFK